MRFVFRILVVIGFVVVLVGNKVRLAQPVLAVLLNDCCSTQDCELPGYSRICDGVKPQPDCATNPYFCCAAQRKEYGGTCRLAYTGGFHPCDSWGPWTGCVGGYNSRVCNSDAYIFDLVACGGSACSDTYPACGGACPDGQTCKAKNGYGTCECKDNPPDCPGGWIWVGPNNSVRRCCQVKGPPDAPILDSPANGAQLTAGDITLRWQPPLDWGTECRADSKSVKVQMGFASGGENTIASIDVPLVTDIASNPANDAIVVTGKVFPPAGSTVTVTLQYQSNPVNFTGTTQILSKTTELPNASNVACASLAGKTGWNADYGFAMVTTFDPDASAYYVESAENVYW